MDQEPRSPNSVAFIGLGDMGGAMAHNLIDKGWHLALYARKPGTLESFAGRQVLMADTARDAAAACRYLCLCVVDAVQIEAVLFGADGAAAGLKPGSIVLIHSTISPSEIRDFAKRLAAQGVGLIDAPVTGAAQRGRDGTLTIPVGAFEEDYDACKALLADLGSTVVRLGPPGSGQLGKLLNNGLFILQVTLVDEMVRAGTALGLDADSVLEVIDSGTASSWASGFCRQSGRRGSAVFDAYETSYPGGVIEIVRKDTRLLATELAEGGLGDWRIRELVEQAVDSLA